MSAHQTPSDIEAPLPWETTIGRVLDRVTDGNPGKTCVEIGGKS